MEHDDRIKDMCDTCDNYIRLIDTSISEFTQIDLGYNNWHSCLWCFFI